MKAAGYHQSFAETKSIREMVSRGGGMAASGLLKITNRWVAENPDSNVLWERSKKVRFNKR